MTGLEDTGIASGTVGDLVGYGSEQLLDGLLVLQHREDEATVGHIILLGAVDKGLGINTQSFGLCQGGIDSLVHDEGNGHVGEQRVAVSLLSAKVVEFLIVSHRYTSLIFI